MSQTTAIISGGVVIVAIAGLLYVYSGDEYKKSTVRNDVAVEDKTLTLESTTTPVINEAIKNETPMTTNAPLATSAQTEVTLKTTMGDITLRLATKDAPKTTENFLKLARSGFYNGVRFHRVIKGFMIQGGDPLSKDDTQVARWGTGGPGYQFADEINAASALYQKGYKRGVLAMANSGTNTNGSQFFIMHQDYALPPSYTIFGEVVKGIEVVDKIATTPTASGDRPVTPVTVTSVEVK
ncbi:MAG: peptidylprolyl isomerase [bacterium]|nr:peptidylprolyl isomerase [bacterium]